MRGSEEKNTRGTSAAMRVITIVLTAIVILLLCFVVCKIFFFTWAAVDQRSMYPTFEDGETVFVNRLGDAGRGDIAVYFDSDVSAPRLTSAFGLFAGDSKMLIKRIVATEGDEIWLEYNDDMSGLELRIRCADTGEVIEEEYSRGGERIKPEPLAATADSAGVLLAATRWDPYIVGEDCVFVMGDNRAESVDSRVYGDVPVSRIIGTVV